MRKNYSKKGFTLVELLVVIAIIVIISTIAIAALNPAKILAKARDGSRKTDLGGIKSAIELYYSQNRAYPAAADVTFGGVFDDAAGNVYLKKTPNDPTSTWSYCYSLSGGNYSLCASVEDSGSANSGVTPCTLSGNTSPTPAGSYCLTNPF